jgi:hypothetical protein
MPATSRTRPLPIGPGILVGAKSLALLLFVSTFALALNAIPTLVFPAAWMSLVPIGFMRALSLSAAHALVTLAAAAFGFSVILALRSLVLLVGGPRIFRRLSVVLQFLLVLSLLTAFFLVPAAIAASRRGRAGARLAAYVVPASRAPDSRGLLADPQLLRDGSWREPSRRDLEQWAETMIRGASRARRRYELLRRHSTVWPGWLSWPSWP